MVTWGVTGFDTGGNIDATLKVQVIWNVDSISMSINSTLVDKTVLGWSREYELPMGSREK